jgi:hypothetical protein
VDDPQDIQLGWEYRRRRFVREPGGVELFHRDREVRFPRSRLAQLGHVVRDGLAKGPSEAIDLQPVRDRDHGNIVDAVRYATDLDDPEVLGPPVRLRELRRSVPSPCGIGLAEVFAM